MIGGNLMKLKFFAFFCLIAVFLAGCTGQVSETPEQKAINLADNSEFGKAFAFFSSFFGRGENCNFDKFVAIYEKQAQIPAEDKEQLKTYFESAKKCLPELNKNAEKKGEEFEVTYSFKVPDTCENEGMKTMMDQGMQSGPFSNLTATVNLDSGEVTEPALPQDAGSMGAETWKQYHEKAETQMEQAMAQTTDLTEEEKETMMDCTMVASLTMYGYMQESMQEQPSIQIEQPKETEQTPPETPTMPTPQQ